MMDMPGSSHLDGKLAGQYNRLSGERDEWLDAARVFSALTSAAVMPQEQRATPNNRIVPHNNLGAIGVITLAAKISLQLLPPNQPFFRMSVKPEVISEITETTRSQSEQESSLATQVLNEIQESLVDLEGRLVKEIGRENIRANSHEVFLQLLVAGTVVFYVPEEGPTSVFDLRQFVVQRDPAGTVLQLILREEVAIAGLTENQRAAHSRGGVVDFSPVGDQEIIAAPRMGHVGETVEIYTGVELIEKDKYRVWQEITGHLVPNSEGMFKANEVPYMVLRWRPVVGEHYSHAYVSDLEGDLRTLEGLSKAVKEGALLASRFIGGVRPDAPPGLEKKITRSANGSFHRFSPDDVFFAQAGKFSDLQVASNTLIGIEARLRAAFLMNSTRNAERVTAEEIRQNFAELNTALGGSFASLANDFQSPLLQRLLKRLKKRGGLAGIEDALTQTEPIITTGLDAIGRNAELNNLLAFTTTLTQAVGPQAVSTLLNTSEMATRIANATSVNPSNLIRTPEEIQQQTQQAALLEAGVNAAGPAASAAINNGLSLPQPPAEEQ